MKYRHRYLTLRILILLNILINTGRYNFTSRCVIVSDVRFIEEIKIIKDNFKNVISIGVIRPNYKSDLTKEQEKDITETALDDYNDYDFKIINDKSEVELYNNTLDILKKIEKEGI